MVYPDLSMTSHFQSAQLDIIHQLGRSIREHDICPVYSFPLHSGLYSVKRTEPGIMPPTSPDRVGARWDLEEPFATDKWHIIYYTQES